MKENKSKKFHFHLPKLTPLNLILMILIPIVLFIIIAIPIVYVNEYNANKVNLFASDLEKVDKKEIVYGNKNTKMDFDFVLYCTNYDNASGTIKFQAFAYENKDTRNVINLANKIKVRLGMYSDWIKVEQTSSSYEKYIGTGPRTAKEQSRSRFDFTIYNIPKLPKKGKLPFVNITSIPVYAYITYTTTINGTESNKKFILKYNYSDYVIESKTIEDHREKELNVSSTNIQWKYKNDITWTNSINVDDLIGIEVRNQIVDVKNEDGETKQVGYIQWKRKCDTEWTNLKAFTELTGYAEGKVPEVKVESGYIRWRFEEGATWNLITSTSSLKDIEVKADKDSPYILWRRKNQEEYTRLIAFEDLPGYTSDKVVEARVSGSNVQWRFTTTSTWTTLQTVDSLIGIRVQFDENRNVLWKCVDDTEWKNLFINGVQATEANLDTSAIKYGPTAGGIE
ncbi:MAG: hypothetical protein K2K48_01775 [Anaeroplasmataceae bacterium]|nr:hypothetical protein [Anaeroplasmataceae bacterium]MDE6414119.1 hypothetical protein [Anaeroplasmataceae bacterium]